MTSSSLHNSMLLLPSLLLGSGLLCSPQLAAQSPLNEQRAIPNRQSDTTPVDFEREIAPILSQHCVACHGATKREGGLRLTNRLDALTPADSGEPVLVPGDAAQSTLWERISTKDATLRMPPEAAPLSPDELALIRRWIEEGVTWPESAGSRSTHWAYLKPVRPALPPVKQQDWPQGSIDQFILAKMEAEGFSPAPPVAKESWLRRVSLGLIGLPPTIEELENYLADESPSAEERVVDRLLASPRFGEHWARLWLDLARYADTNGYQADQYRDSWAYRDWVVQAFNSDMPFDQFVIEQLAGDLLPEATVEQRIATGFHRTVTCNVEAGVHPEENRVNQVFDRVNTTGTVFLGTTLECAQCHNHKYDPVSQHEYFQLFAYFNNTPLEVGDNSGVQFNFVGPKMELPIPAAQQVERDRLQHQEQQLQQQRTERLAAALLRWESRVAARTPDSEVPEVHWQPLEVAAVTSTGGETFTLRDDHSVLVGGEVPQGSTEYQMQLRQLPERITALQLECLTDPSLPGQGPGRGDPVRTNFILSELAVSLDGEPVGLSSAEADFSQQNWPVSAAIDGDLKTGWAIAPEFSKPHWARFVLENPLLPQADAVLTLRLQQHYGQGRTIGCFRVSATSADPELLSVPNEILSLLMLSDRKPAQVRQLEKWVEQHEPAIRELDANLKQVRQALDNLAPPTTLVMVELETPRETQVMIRGDYLNPGPTVSPGTLQNLHPRDPEWPENRLGLAYWLVDRNNPLLARVTVNRWWAELWGAGIVSTLEDFGTQSEPPTHPELLDWLAVEFMEQNWSMKQLLRQIVLSAAYRQSAHVYPDHLARDPLNRWLSRGPRFRMSAEMIRDNGLQISGLLSDKIGGPPVMPYQPEGLWNLVGRNAPVWKPAEDEDRFRRGIYVYWRRGAPYPSFVNFDAPDRAACVTQRSRTNTPTQALTLLNDPAWLEMALGLAGQILQSSSADSDAAKVRVGWRRAVTREPTPPEVEILLTLLNAERERFRQHPQQATRLLNGMRPVSAMPVDDPVELAAWVHVANVLLNLDETITRN